jgi:DNA-binding transcriptional ArsR family regulator
MKRWSLIFKTLSNVNRLKIIKLLVHGKILNVGDIARELNVSVKTASKHLIILNNLDVVDYIGKDNHVFYSLNKNMPKDFKSIINFL